MVLCIISSHIFQAVRMYRGVGTDHDRMGAQIEDHLDGCRGTPTFSSRTSSRAFSSVMNLNCLLTKKSAAHFSEPLSLYHKVSREPAHACSILDDTLNPIWLEVCSFTLLHPLLLIVCVIACVCVCACRTACACANLCGGAGRCVSCLCGD